MFEVNLLNMNCVFIQFFEGAVTGNVILGMIRHEYELNDRLKNCSVGREVEWILPVGSFAIGVSHKCRGYGKLLLNKMIEEARRHELECLFGFVDVDHENPFDLTSWYLRRGFEIIGRLNPSEGGNPVIYMRL